VNAGPFSERIYHDVRDLVMGREASPGTRLDPAVLAKQLNSSTTPVREALNRLVGERLVETRTSTGYHLPLLDEPALKDLIGWSAEILALSLKRVTGSIETAAAAAQSSAYPDRVAAAFSAMARAAGHAEYGPAIGQANAKLHAIRLGEPETFGDSEIELSHMIDAMRTDRLDDLKKLVQSYHRRRQRHAAELLRRRYRAQ
jgi:DNA-binding GntR family transcriptional regulator